MSRILLVDDDPHVLDSTRKILELAGYEVETARDGQEALEKVRPSLSETDEHPVFDIVVTDVRMPRLGGIEFLRAISICGRNIPVVLMTAFGRVEEAVWAMKMGAVDFLTKPFKRQAILDAVESALKRSRTTAQTEMPEKKGEQIVGVSDAVKQLRQMVNKVAATDGAVLITGESGTGKELVARCIHEKSNRQSGPFIAINCAAIPEQLMESELFGHEKGAFSGAVSQHVGLLEAANGGTLLLDEIGDMPILLQSKLLRVLQEKEIRRVGAIRSKKVDLRVIAATNCDLKMYVKQGRFREDLLFRLDVLGIRIPPLRERMEDVLELAAHFLRHTSERDSVKGTKQIFGMTKDAMEALLAHEWPGNIRELSNVIERAVVFASGDQITLNDLPRHLVENVRGVTAGPMESIAVPLGTPLKDVEELLIRKTLEATSGDKNMTAKLLGVNSRTIYRKIVKNQSTDVEEPDESAR